MNKINLTKEEIEKIIEGYFDKKISVEEEKIKVLKNIPLKQVKEKIEELPKEINLLREGYFEVKVTKLLPNGNALGGLIDANGSRKIYIFDATENKIKKAIYLVNKESINHSRKGLHVDGYDLFTSKKEVTVSSMEIEIWNNRICCKAYYFPVYGVTEEKESRIKLEEPYDSLLKVSAENSEEVLRELRMKINESLIILTNEISNLQKEKEETLNSYEIVRVNANGGSADGYSRGYVQPPKYEYYIVKKGSNPDYWQYRFPRVPEDLIPQD